MSGRFSSSPTAGGCVNADVCRGQVSGGQAPVDGAFGGELVAEEDLKGEQTVTGRCRTGGRGCGLQGAREGEIDPVRVGRGEEPAKVRGYPCVLQQEEVEVGHAADRLALAGDLVRHAPVVEDGVVVGVLEDADAFAARVGGSMTWRFLVECRTGTSPLMRRPRAVIRWSGQAAEPLCPSLPGRAVTALSTPPAVPAHERSRRRQLPARWAPGDRRGP